MKKIVYSRHSDRHIDGLNAMAAGDTAEIFVAPVANHMDVVDARSGFAESVAREVQRLLTR